MKTFLSLVFVLLCFGIFFLSGATYQAHKMQGILSVAEKLNQDTKNQMYSIYQVALQDTWDDFYNALKESDIAITEPMQFNNLHHVTLNFGKIFAMTKEAAVIISGGSSITVTGTTIIGTPRAAFSIGALLVDGKETKYPMP